MKLQFPLPALAVLALAGAHSAAGHTLKLTVAAGDHGHKNVPVRATVSIPAALGHVSLATLVDGQGKKIVGQLTKPGVLNHAEVRGQEVARELHFILDELKAGQNATFTATIESGSQNSAGAFAWHDTPGKHTELRYGDRPVLRYMYAPFDDSTQAAREETYKVYHHLYDPSGSRIVTKGSGGLFPHHRGLFYGFNKVSYHGVARVDLWHCQGDNYQSHEGFLASEEGPVLGRHRVAIDWHGKGKQVFAREEREMAVYHVPGGQLVEFASRLSSTVGDVKLDGDPQHAGFQFRASNEVAEKTIKQTYYLRPDGRGKPGETRNWPDNKQHANLPWNGMSFVVEGNRYTAAYLDKPTNPKEARYSERDYGRFGSYFEYELTAEEPLEVNYRLWLQEGEMTGDEAAALDADFVQPPQVTITGN